MRKVYLTQSPSHDYKISISPLGEDDQAVIAEPETPDTPEGEETDEENKITYHKEVMLYTAEASYLGQKKTI
jgi:hypothetical protein